MYSNLKLLSDLHQRKVFVAAAIGGSTAAVIAQPIDTVKTRIQIVGHQYNHSITQCFKQIQHSEGTLSLWKGVTGPLCSMLLKNGFLFTAEDLSMQLLRKNQTASEQRQNLVKNHVIAGGMAGATQSIITTPSELAKCRLQMNGLNSKAKTTYKFGAVSMIFEIYKSHGIRGTMRGFYPTVLREVPSFSAYFGSYYSLVDLGQRWFDFREPTKIDDVATRNFAWSLLSGGLAGCCGWAVSYPFDVIKTKIQTDCFDKQEYRTIKRTGVMLVREGGVLALYQGFRATMVRAFVVNSITFSTTMLVKNYLIG